MVAERYQSFLTTKQQSDDRYGFKPNFMPDFLYGFQKEVVEWGVEMGRWGNFADCGLGKTPMELVTAENIVRHTNKPVILGTYLGVAGQIVREAEKFGIECRREYGSGKAGIVVTNYEKLHQHDPSNYGGAIFDEAGAIKSFGGARQRAVTDFVRKMPYRNLASATPAPNDYTEFGTISEALGYLGRMDMLGTFFKSDEDSLHPKSFGSKFRFKAHAEERFWQWLASFARAYRKPSDLGYSDKGFILPPLIETEHVVECREAFGGALFPQVAVTLQEQRQERRLTLRDRCEKVASLLDHDEPAVAWAHLNDEGDLMTEMIPGAVQVSGSDADEEKEEKFLAFSSGQIRVLVTKPSIGAWGLNWQHCAHTTLFPSHSFEQYYQCLRRFWRLGQTRSVRVDLVTTEGEADVLRNHQRKQRQAEAMFDRLVLAMRDARGIDRSVQYPKSTEIPAWLC